MRPFEYTNPVTVDAAIALPGSLLGRALGFYGPGKAAGFVIAPIGAMTLPFRYRLRVARRA
jgi:hypothetical protein